VEEIAAGIARRRLNPSAIGVFQQAAYMQFH
jgi:hypothetical protein